MAAPKTFRSMYPVLVASTGVAGFKTKSFLSGTPLLTIYLTAVPLNFDPEA